MREFFHGVRVVRNSTPVNAPVTVSSGIVFCVGTAPVHTVSGGGSVNEPIRARNFNEAAAALGYSDDWGKYDICEVMFGLFRDYNTGPAVFVNVLDPARHRTAVAPVVFTLSGGRAALPLEAIVDTVTVSGYTLGTDYELYYRDGALIFEAVPGGAITSAVTEVTIGYSAVDPSQVTAADIIGGLDLTTKKRTGLELIETVFPKYGLLPDLCLCPKWSSNPATAAVMTAKMENYNGIFNGVALIDIDSSVAAHYEDAVAWKSSNGFVSKRQVLCWPMVTRGGRTYHMSTHMAGLITREDFANENVPSESPSNKPLLIGSMVLADGTEVFLDLQEANYLNANGITTALNFRGWVLWGNYTAAYPNGSDDPYEHFLYAVRMGDWLSNTIILSHWGRIDGKLNERLIESILDTVNIWFNGLATDQHLIGGRAEFPGGFNTVESFRQGKIRFILYYAVQGIAQEITHELTFDPQYIEDLLAALAGGGGA